MITMKGCVDRKALSHFVYIKPAQYRAKRLTLN